MDCNTCRKCLAPLPDITGDNPMVKQTHTVATDALATLGTIIDERAGRDAIHLAVEPVIASQRLYPGQDVGLVDGGAGPTDNPVGIVDPFLKQPVNQGEKFWLVVYPRQITSLRHVWEHPAFGDAPANKPEPTDKKAASEAWLRDFVSRSDCPDYHTVVGAALNGGDDNWDDDYLHFNGSDAHGEIPDEFWDHIEIVTGQRITRRAKYFSCSC